MHCLAFTRKNVMKTWEILSWCAKTAMNFQVMWMCRQIRRFLEHVRTWLSKCNHPGQKNIPSVTATFSFLFFFELCVFNYAAWSRESSAFWKTTHALPVDSCGALAASQELSNLTYWIVEKLVDRLKDCLLPLPLCTSALIDTGS